jgi:uncharacterized membrane protein
MHDIHPPSALRFVGHPIQTLLSSFSGAYFIAALITDFAYFKSANMMWANFSSWLLVAGLVIGGFAILTAFVNAIRQRHLGSRRPAWLMLLGLVVVWVLSLLNAFIHSRDAWTSVVPTGITLSAVVTVILLVLGWIGWTNAVRNRVGAL